ncbi:hypothetical protein C8A01DRAFT_41327 [Parachaetomium inaequale]|uniref:Uncharacterized protein n=1 Tax=Parachaetomium inaequale TaxID=2588326 RepID=A0AAN6SLN7_9PEZI|nr:hypothetical protein C8A01DRAFT_41327 [Parachaetomium inaequale]
MASTPSQLEAGLEEQPPTPVKAATNTANVEAVDATDAADHDRPVRILVQTTTHLVPGDKSMGFGERVDGMVKLICHHVWQRDYDPLRERQWMHGGAHPT